MIDYDVITAAIAHELYCKDNNTYSGASNQCEIETRKRSDDAQNKAYHDNEFTKEELEARRMTRKVALRKRDYALQKGLEMNKNKETPNNHHDKSLSRNDSI